MGYNIYEAKNGENVAVINLQGRIFMTSIDCPFRTADKIVAEVSQRAKLIFVDFHAEATSEKQALGWYLDGRVSGVFGTHTHVQTADERVFPGGTAYITDAGMTGPYESVIGVQVNDAFYRIMSGLPNRFNLAEGDIRLAAVSVDVDPGTGKATSIERIMYRYQRPRRGDRKTEEVLVAALIIDGKKISDEIKSELAPGSRRSARAGDSPRPGGGACGR